jgi:hypothetical protein
MTRVLVRNRLGGLTRHQVREGSRITRCGLYPHPAIIVTAASPEAEVHDCQRCARLAKGQPW